MSILCAGSGALCPSGFSARNHAAAVLKMIIITRLNKKDRKTGIFRFSFGNIGETENVKWIRCPLHQRICFGRKGTTRP